MQGDETYLCGHAGGCGCDECDEWEWACVRVSGHVSCEWACVRASGHPYVRASGHVSV